MGTSSKKSTKGSSSAATPQTEGVVVKRVARSVLQHLPKPRAGFEDLVEPMIALVEKYSAELTGGGIDVELMRSSLAAYKGLANEHDTARNYLAGIENTRTVQLSSCWMQFLLIYDRSRSMGRANTDLLADAQQFEAFMKLGPRKRKTTTVTPVTPPTTTTP